MQFLDSYLVFLKILEHLKSLNIYQHNGAEIILYVNICCFLFVIEISTFISPPSSLTLKWPRARRKLAVTSVNKYIFRNLTWNKELIYFACR